MSAFEVCGTHIDIMISAALQLQYGETLYWYHGDIPHTEPGEMLPGGSDYVISLEKGRRQVTRENAETWGAALLAENRRSVNHRYAEEELEELYTFTRYEGQFSPVAVIKAVNCYEYQSCEHPGWETSEAHSFCQALTSRMIHILPGYESAPWEVTDASQATVGAAMRVR